MGSKGRKEASVEIAEKARENQIEDEVKVISINYYLSYISLLDSSFLEIIGYYNHCTSQPGIIFPIVKLNLESKWVTVASANSLCFPGFQN